MERITVIAEGLSGEIKIRDFLKRRLRFSTSLIGVVKFGGVFINGENVHMRATVKNGDTVDIYLPSEDSETVEPIEIPLDVLYEDERILVINKPRNMPIHPSRGNHLPTLASAVRAYMGAPFVFRCITRLDRDTSGIVLIAKDRIAAAILSNSMARGEIKKRYTADVVGIPNPPSGIIDAPIARLSEGSIKRGVVPEGKRSITEYTLISSENGRSTLSVSPITGRTHQIRVHLSYIGHPLYADFLYGERVEGETYKLHCSELEFRHPDDGRQIIIKSEPTTAN